MTVPVLVTLTSPTAAGKSFLYNYIRDVLGLPCLVSTTTRRRRPGEVQGVDYYFIDNSESLRLEHQGQFVELVTYLGVRYGVTKAEFNSKISTGLTFLIVEPSGIDSYAQPVLEAGAVHLKYYVHTDPELRLERFKNRVLEEVELALQSGETRASREADVKAVVGSAITRLAGMFNKEKHWGTAQYWDRVLSGSAAVEDNVAIIMNDVAKAKKLKLEQNNWKKEY